ERLLGRVNREGDAGRLALAERLQEQDAESVQGGSRLPRRGLHRRQRVERSEEDRVRIYQQARRYGHLSIIALSSLVSHSPLRALIGSTRAARRLGRNAAIAATVSKSAQAAPNVATSDGETSKNRARKVRKTSHASVTPAAVAATNGRSASPSTCATICFGRAPSAMRTPISRVRATTVSVTRP